MLERDHDSDSAHTREASAQVIRAHAHDQLTRHMLVCMGACAWILVQHGAVAQEHVRVHAWTQKQNKNHDRNTEKCEYT